MKNRKQKQGTAAEPTVTKKLQSLGWNIIPTRASKSPIDLLGYHKRRKKWWGIQVKSTASSFTFEYERVARLCKELHFDPVLAWVDPKKPRQVEFCIRKAGRFYHVFENGEINHPLEEDYDCRAFKEKISIGVSLDQD